MPVTAGIVVLAYNLPGLGGPLRLSRDVYVDIFAGRIQTWNDPRIRAANPGAQSPEPDHRRRRAPGRQRDDVRAHEPPERGERGLARSRARASGTLVDWPGNAMRARGNEGVAARIKVSEGSIGYVEYHFAKRLGLAMAQLQNRAGRFVAPSERSGQTALARNVKQMPENLRLFLPDPEGEDAYPIVSFSWLLLYERYADPARPPR